VTFAKEKDVILKKTIEPKENRFEVFFYFIGRVFLLPTLADPDPNPVKVLVR
jgi:hypothetical protein